MEDIEDDEEPEDSEEDDDDEGEEDDEEEDDDEGDESKPSEDDKISSLSSFSFGGNTANQNSTNIFGGSSVPKTNDADKKAEAPKSIFSGLNLATSSSSLFGGNSTGASTTPSLFGGLSSVANTATTPSIFGQTSASESTPAFGTSTIFGNKSSEAAATNIFAAAATNASQEPKAVDFTSASKDLPTFSALNTSSTGGFSFGKKTEGFSFDGAGASVFKPSPNKTSAEDADHDPHFEPIIPLPELINVTTGEEDEEVIFKHRAKVYRFDKDVKQWKERGVGDIKILNHKAKNTFRVLLRRDQVHKIACNHYISQDQKLEPMQSSDTALTWLAIDFSEDEVNGMTEKLAVRFKLAETKDEFKKVFEEAQEKLKNGPPPPKANVDADDDDEYEDEETADDDQSDDSDNTMFEKICELKEVVSENTEAPLGTAVLKILYDEDVYR